MARLSIESFDPGRRSSLRAQCVERPTPSDRVAVAQNQTVMSGQWCLDETDQTFRCTTFPSSLNFDAECVAGLIAFFTELRLQRCACRLCGAEAVRC